MRTVNGDTQCIGVLAAALSLVSIVLAQPVSAHEFWIDAINYTPKPGARVALVHRTGSEYLGDTYPFLRKYSKRFSVIDPVGERQIKAIDGDDPVAEVSLPNEGLAIIAYQRAPDRLVHPTFERFTEVSTYEGLDNIPADHKARGMPETGIKEDYARFAKALLKVGDGRGADRAVGLPLEIVVAGNPYELAPGAPIGVQVLRDGKPAANILVKAFNLSDQESPRHARTDANGRAEIAGVPAGEVLLNAVMMDKAQPSSDADWMSFWASLTFKRP
jgi:uncharacterized GH25 family protein